MKCPKCNYDNAEDASFCNLCHEVLNKAAPPAAAVNSAAPAAQNPAAPVARPEQTMNPEETGDPATLKKISEGWIAAMVCGSLTLIAGLLAGMIPALAELISPWAIVDAALIFILGFGIRRKSRAAATIMFLYYLLAKIDMWVSSGKPSCLLVAVIFIWYFFRAMTATFDYHKGTAAGPSR